MLNKKQKSLKHHIYLYVYIQIKSLQYSKSKRKSLDAAHECILTGDQVPFSGYLKSHPFVWMHS